MGYFRNLPDILYQSPLPHKVSTQEFIQIKNIFRRSKVVDYVNDNITLFQKYILEDGDRPDSVAEALYKDPEILIFDEATSALDYQTEKKIIDTINSLKNQKTIIIVSHRMSTLNICDEIFELRDRTLKKFIK